MEKKKIDRIIEAFRKHKSLIEDGGMGGGMMTTGSTPGSPGFSGLAPAEGPTAGFDPVMGLMKRLSKKRKKRKKKKK